MIRFGVFLWTLSTAVAAGAHHSVSAFYDSDTTSELEGTITSLDWINPHVRFRLETLNENGQREVWALESGSVNMLDRHGVTRENLAVGNEITVVGHLSRHGRKEMIAGYITLPDGENVVLWSGLFGGLEATGSDPLAHAAGPATEPRGIFRVWTEGRTYSDDATDTSAGMALPFTPEAVAARASYDPLTEDTALRCIPQGMPGIMDNPFPMEFLSQGEDIILRLEEWDVARTIHMGADATASNPEPSPHGYSVGRWDADTLVVTTTRIEWPFFDDVGTPQSEDVEVIERFRLADDESRLDYTITVTDPMTFTEPVTLEGYWVWVPGEEIKPYNCTL